MRQASYIACDLGAESGRVLLGTLAENRLSLEEIHRFPNGPVSIGATLRWDVLRIFEELKLGIKMAAGYGASVAGISCDSWGVDYVLLSGHGPMLTVPYHYRDPRTDGAMERAFAVVPADEIFEETGIQFMAINTLYQLLADLQTRPEILESADKFLNIGDYFNYLLSGCCVAEESLASTTQLYNPRSRDWSGLLIQRFGLPEKIFPKLIPSGTPLAGLLPPIASETGVQGARVIAGCSHDTAAAVAAVPVQNEDWAYLSSGTWSLLGIEAPKPIIGPKSRLYNFTNEAGFGGTSRFLKNIVGLWVVQECRREWARQGREFGYPELTAMAEECAPLRSFIDPTRPEFLKPDRMPQKIAEYCRATGQPVPETPGEVIRCALESLALVYRRTLEQLGDASGKKTEVLHIVGGGSRNHLLNQLAANATRMRVQAGPGECTGIGNVIVQAIALGHLPSLAAGRGIVCNSFPTVLYEPEGGSAWEEAYRRFSTLIL